MIDDRDPLLTRLFAEQGQPAHESGFMAQFIERFERDLRYRRIYRIGTIIASVIVAALLAPNSNSATGRVGTWPRLSRRVSLLLEATFWRNSAR